MDIFHSIVLGIIQGFTEFLPISSSGHLVLYQRIFGFNEEAMAFIIMLHVATLVSVIAVFWKEIWHMIRYPFSKATIFVIVATIPVAVIGFIFRDFFEYIFSSGNYLGIAFILTGIILLIADRPRKQAHYGKDLSSMSYIDAILMGLAQSVAIIPALSRSGFIISAGLLRGLKKEFVIKFAFLMSVPAIIGPAVFDAHNLTFQALQNIGVLPLLFGMIAAAITGYISIRFMLDFFSRASLKVFAYYVFVLGALILVDQLFFRVIF